MQYKHLGVYSSVPFPPYPLLPDPPTSCSDMSQQLHDPAATAESHVSLATMDLNPSNSGPKETFSPLGWSQ